MFLWLATHNTQLGSFPQFLIFFYFPSAPCSMLILCCRDYPYPRTFTARLDLQNSFPDISVIPVLLPMLGVSMSLDQKLATPIRQSYLFFFYFYRFLFFFLKSRCEEFYLAGEPVEVTHAASPRYLSCNSDMNHYLASAEGQQFAKRFLLWFILVYKLKSCSFPKDRNIY